MSKQLTRLEWIKQTYSTKLNNSLIKRERINQPYAIEKFAEYDNTKTKKWYELLSSS